jgi:polyisoprenoid-binding protein YceI
MALSRASALLTGATLTLILAACGGSPSAAPDVPPPSSAVGTAGSASSPASSPAGAPAAAAATSSAASGATSAAAGQSAAVSPNGASSGPVKLVIAPNAGSQIDIKMRELLAGNVAQNDAVESTKTVSGTVSLDATGAVLPGSKISLDLRTLKSDRSQRDNFIKGRFVLDTQQFPMVDFTIKQVQGLDGGTPTAGQKTFKLIGDATVKGVTTPLTWDVTATFDGQDVQGQASTSFKLSDFGMQPPKAGPVVQVEDAGNLVMKFQATRSA